MLAGDVGRHAGIGGVVAGVAPRDDQRPGRLVDRDLRLELRPAAGVGVEIGLPAAEPE